MTTSVVNPAALAQSVVVVSQERPTLTNRLNGFLETLPQGDPSRVFFDVNSFGGSGSTNQIHHVLPQSLAKNFEGLFQRIAVITSGSKQGAYGG
jgi:hypothetical protein